MDQFTQKIRKQIEAEKEKITVNAIAAITGDLWNLGEEYSKVFPRISAVKTMTDETIYILHESKTIRVVRFYLPYLNSSHNAGELKYEINIPYKILTDGC